jgi:hypothetical protein
VEKNSATQLKTLSKEVSEMATDLRGDAVMEVSAAFVNCWRFARPAAKTEPIRTFVMLVSTRCEPVFHAAPMTACAPSPSKR